MTNKENAKELVAVLDETIGKIIDARIISLRGEIYQGINEDLFSIDEELWDIIIRIRKAIDEED